MTDRSRTTLIGFALSLGFVLPFLVGFVAEQCVRGNFWMTGTSPQLKIDRTDPIFPSWRDEPPDKQYRVAKDSTGRIHADLRNKPKNLSLLISEPNAIEPQLRRGRWLVLVYSVLSSEDMQAFINSRELAQRLTGFAGVAAVLGC